MKSRLIIVGGFLGSGKTTLLWESARKLTEKGTKVGLITNDQAAELVDTAFLEQINGNVEEVSGSCFCCNFHGFTDAIIKLSKNTGCDLIIAEPVGSCTDLSSTILQPLKDKFNENLLISPLSVLVDPERLLDILNGGTSGLHKSAAYILRKQLEEADLILISKSDLMDQKKVENLVQSTSIEWPSAKIFAISSLTGDGLAEWFDEVLTRTDSGTHLTEVDYDTYAEGEAVLGWYNASYSHIGETDWNLYLELLMKALQIRFEKEGAAIGHLKIMLQNSESFSVANLTGANQTITIRGSLKKSDDVKLTINARVQISPDELENGIEKEIFNICEGKIKYEKIASKCLSPGRPNPTFRYNQII